MGKRYLIDTNVIIDFANNRIPPKGTEFVATLIDTEPYISFITKIELLGFSNVSNEVIEFAESTEVFYCDSDILNICIELRKRKKIKLPDALIAATAIHLDCIILTRNTADFRGLDDLQYLNPYDIS